MKIDKPPQRDDDEFVVYFTRKELQQVSSWLSRGSMNDLWKVGDSLVNIRDWMREALR